MVLDSTLQLTFEKLPLVEFWGSIKGEYPQLSQEAIKVNPPFSSYICVRLNFLHKFQPKQYISTD